MSVHDDDWAAAQPAGFAELLNGAIDVHVHGQSDLVAGTASRGADEGVLRLAQRYGMAGWVLKSHLWPTTDRAFALRRIAGPDFAVHGSFTLNPALGGVSPTVVELAAAHGASVIFFPTWGAAADAGRGGYITGLLRRLSPSIDTFVEERAIRVVDGNGELTGAARETLDACAALGLSVATGHVDLAESTAIVEHCAGVEHTRVLVTHPLHYVNDAGELRRFTDAGVLVELAAAPLLHPDAHLHVRDLARAVETLGPDQLVLSSDVFSRWVPPEPECLRLVAEQLVYLGVDRASVHRMLAVNPRRFLGIGVDSP
ncbi:hypothetical protein SAMN05443637_107126 [Pseudonocardia thermophila]|jgi:hypothetical protein|uniref:Amidohydrolase n=1 Tax=Pseudonocardia thermophila TaxID=1848 RepID=A0A1M6T3D4_PSETH|nr:DUF6282 family protein [Pseudonocardia thermophila]SHK51430.1 hypothetical protein SAMN05443637_107126 [Pseudonocardia thermophila]